MVAMYVGVTDGDWFRFLSQRPDIREANFWQPVDTRRFVALTPGELFLFKLKAPDHFIAGGGLLSVRTPTRLHWHGPHLERVTGSPVSMNCASGSVPLPSVSVIIHSTRRAIRKSAAAF